jgi:hypothetical protein
MMLRRCVLRPLIWFTGDWIENVGIVPCQMFISPFFHGRSSIRIDLAVHGLSVKQSVHSAVAIDRAVLRCTLNVNNGLEVFVISSMHVTRLYSILHSRFLTLQSFLNQHCVFSLSLFLNSPLWAKLVDGCLPVRVSLLRNQISHLLILVNTAVPNKFW